MVARNEPRKTQSGAVIQSGIDARPRADVPRFDPRDRPFRAVVLEARVVGDEDNIRGLSVECDVLLVRSGIVIRGAQVLQRAHGVNNAHGLWIPKGTTRDVVEEGHPLNLSRTHSRRGTPVGEITPLGNVDGDQVLLDFIEGRIDYPLIVGALTHEQTNRLVETGDGWREGDAGTRGHPRRGEFYVHHQGAELRVNEQGDVLIDTVGAYEDGATEDASDTGYGQVRIRVKEGQRFTVALGDDDDVLEVWKDGGQLRIDLGEGATERLVLGDSFRSYVNDQVKAYVDAHTHLPGTFLVTLPGPSTVNVTGVSGAPVTTMPSMAETLLSDLAKTKRS